MVYYSCDDRKRYPLNDVRSIAMKKNNESGEFNVGRFEIKSSKVLVSDPCYQLDTWCNGIVNNVRNGK